MVLDDIFWQTVYADGKEFTEPEENLSIRAAWPGAVELRIGVRGGPWIGRLDLTPGVPIPIFYRIRGITVGDPDITETRREREAHGKPTMDAVVFGSARAVEGEVAAQLWSIGRDGIPRSCERRFIDPSALKLIAEAFV